jgi:NAD(P)-dependent dehydrogenase (short-subunit alcohol dehydrogenase family)
MKLKDKIAIVTGGSQGIGRGIVESFVEEGADVVINYIRAADKAEEVAAWVRSKGRRALAIQGDVSKREDVDRLLEESQKLGPVDILVNNAGIETIVPFLELTEERVDVLAGLLQACSQRKARGRHHKHWLDPGGTGFAWAHPLRADQDRPRRAYEKHLR